MEQRIRKEAAVLCFAAAVLSIVASGFGVFGRGSGETIQAVSAHGVEYAKVIGGVYANNSARLVAEGVGWDWVTLFFAAPLLLIAVPFILRGSLKARLFAVGILAYLLYQYLEYAVFWAFGPLFPLFIILYPLSGAAIIRIVTTIDVQALPDAFDERFPRRGIIALTLTVAFVLLLMWTVRIIAAYRGNLDTTLAGHPAMVVQALDLGLIVPLAFFTAHSLHKNRPAGYLLSSAFVVKAVTMSLAICAMLISAWKVEGEPAWPPLIFFAATAAVSTFLGAGVFRSMRRSA